MESAPQRRRDGRVDRELHVHTTTEIRGATVFPAWFVPLLVFCLCLSLGVGGAVVGVLSWKIKDLSMEHELLKDYTEGRIDHLPYKPPRERSQGPGHIETERSEP